MIGDAAQYQELVTLYGSYGDDELVELGRGMADLTETAQEALKGELTRRGLKIAPQAKREARVLTEEDLQDMRAYAEVAPAWRRCVPWLRSPPVPGCGRCGAGGA